MSQLNSLNVVVEPVEGSSLDSTYFRTSDVRPEIDPDGNLVIYQGYGSRRSWGNPRVNSHVRELAEDVVKVDVEGWHKHSRSCHGPEGGAYYFVRETGGWRRRTKNHKAVKAALAEPATAS